MPLHDYECLAHGKFESMTGNCPSGCGAALVRKVFLKAAAFHGGKTAQMDKTLQMLADDYKLTDMNNQNGTGPAVKEDWKKVREREELTKLFEQGQTQAMPMAQSKSAVTDTLGSMGFQGDNAIAQVRHQLSQPKPLVHASWSGKD